HRAHLPRVALAALVAPAREHQEPPDPLWPGDRRRGLARLRRAAGPAQSEARAQSGAGDPAADLAGRRTEQGVAAERLIEVDAVLGRRQLRQDQGLLRRIIRPLGVETVQKAVDPILV